MPITYSEIKEYWNSNVCAGGYRRFPFKLFSGKKVLEIGYGTGKDAKKFIEAKTNYTGIDLIDYYPAWPVGNFKQMNAEQMDFPDNYFDLVYSWGVIHHTLNPNKVVDEIFRVLKLGGLVYVMLYGKPSIRYNLDIMGLRKILWYTHYWKYDFLRGTNAHPTQQEWISWNTDNLGCPLSRVYSNRNILDLFDGFENIKIFNKNWGWFKCVMGRK